MYKIRMNGALLHDPSAEAGERRTVIGPELVDELNAFGSLRFRVSQEHVLYDQIEARLSYLAVSDGNGERWRGRVIRSELRWDHTLEVECEGELGYLCDSMQRPFTYYGTVEGMLRQFITNHNAQMLLPDGTADSARRFTVGVCNVPQEDPNERFYRSSDSAKNTWQLIREKLLQPLGGYLQIRVENGVRYLDYLEELTGQSAQVVEYGKNLVSLTVERSEEDLISVLIPYGASFEPGEPDYEERPESNQNWDGNRRTVRSVNSNSDEIVHAAAMARYGRICGTHVWDAVCTPQTLLERAREYLDEHARPEVSISARAVDLSYIDPEEAPIRPGLNVRTVSAPHGVDQLLLCTKQQIFLMELSRGVLELGTVKKTLTQQMGETK